MVSDLWSLRNLTYPLWNDTTKKCISYPFENRTHFKTVRRLWFPTSNRLQTWLIPFGTIRNTTNHDLTQPTLVPPLMVLTSALSRSFRLKGQDKVQKAMEWGQITSDNGWLVILYRPGRSGGDEPSFGGDLRSGTINSAFSTPSYLLALLITLHPSQWRKPLLRMFGPELIRMN